ncbi:hypothetical protein AMK59_302 [Oryctes borbonicus]|uniref:Reverse transcriptase domain-containing protein n=1 Tax=Oryctes borbonicus TaxID=1629725 RepID=A0A0T6BGZ0_9SCAR|nr:hypothetical protein AMK59_302 [Oryctes borbonicus]
MEGGPPIRRIPGRKAPAEYGITGGALRNLPLKLLLNRKQIFNAVLRLTYYPIRWKSVRIIPALKPKKDPHSSDSYRPISLLGTISKILESLLLTRINEHLVHNQVMDSDQFGFRSDNSTTLQLYRITELVTTAFNRNQTTVIVSLDLEKVFDKIRHEGLFLKMKETSFPPRLLKTIRSYLKDRRLHVMVNGTESSERTMLSGVPQGSTLGALLSTIYVMDIPKPEDQAERNLRR